MPGAFAPTDDWLYRHIAKDSPVCRDLRDAASFATWSKGAEIDLWLGSRKKHWDNRWTSSRKIPRQALQRVLSNY
jgi:hypothetical protein